MVCVVYYDCADDALMGTLIVWVPVVVVTCNGLCFELSGGLVRDCLILDWGVLLVFTCPFFDNPKYLPISPLKLPLLPFCGIRPSLALCLHPVPDGTHCFTGVVPLNNLIC